MSRIVVYPSSYLHLLGTIYVECVSEFDDGRKGLTDSYDYIQGTTLRNSVDIPNSWNEMNNIFMRRKLKQDLNKYYTIYQMHNRSVCVWMNKFTST